MINSSDLILSNVVTIESEPLKIKTYSESVNLSLNEGLIIERAKLAANYEEFKNQNNSLESKKELINLSFSQIDDINLLIRDIEFLDKVGFNNSITIKVTLNDGFKFSNNSNIETISISNINWKEQNNKSQPISIDLKYQGLGQKLKEYINADEFIKDMNSKDVKYLSGFLTFDTKYDEEGNEIKSSYQDIYSIKFNRWYRCWYYF